jgi:hypothetical protein
MSAKSRPIPFMPEMVEAIISGRKNQTRRAIKPQPEAANGKLPQPIKEAIKHWDNLIDKGLSDIHTVGIGAGLAFPKCPYGKVGDLLYVKEAHKIIWPPHNMLTIQYRDGQSIERYYKSFSLSTLTNIRKRRTLNKHWVSSQFLPKELARIWLMITDISFEPLLSITEEDARNEGVFEIEKDEAYRDYLLADCGSFAQARGSFLSLWRLINGEDSLSSNPWVWVVKFKVLSTTGMPEALKEKEASHA